ncbi:MAG: hypothetical protein JXL84_21515, partial [Deltaproteobacteria bacterium]|nr:hypothetical protein [Deltaproteobacteria bacterium]
EGELLYRVHEDPDLKHSVAQEKPGLCQELRELAVKDAGGIIPAEFANYHDKPGCTPFEDRSGTRDILFGKAPGH